MRRFIFFISFTVLSVSVMSQVDQKVSTPYQWRWGLYDSAIGLPYGPVPELRRTSNLTRPGYIFTKVISGDTSLHFWTGQRFKQVGFPGLDSIRKSNDTIYEYKTGVKTFSFKDSAGGSGGSFSGTDSAAHHTLRLIDGNKVGFPKESGGEDTLVINTGSNQTLQQIFDTEVGGSVLTKNDTIINKNSVAIIRNLADGASGNFNYETLDTITSTDPYGNKSRFGFYAARTLRIPSYNSTMNYKVGAGLQLNYEIKDSAFIQTWGGDFGNANKSIIKLRKMAGYTGRSLFIGGFNSTEAVAASLSDLSVSDPVSTVGNYRYAKGYWAGNQAFLFMNSYDTLEKWLGNVSAAGLFGNSYIDFSADYFGGKLGAYSVANVKNPWFLFNYVARSKSFLAGATGIGDSIIEESSILDISSTTKGVLLPRMTSAQRTAITAVAGLILFDTDSSSYFQYTGSAWQNLYNSGGGGGSTPTLQQVVNVGGNLNNAGIVIEGENGGYLSFSNGITDPWTFDGYSQGFKVSSDGSGNGTNFNFSLQTALRTISFPDATGILALTSDITASLPTLTKNATIESPGSAENIGMFRTPVAITVTNTHAVLVGSATPSVTYNIAFGTDRTSATNVYTSGQTVTSTTTGTAASGVNDATIPANSWVWFTSSANSGTVTQINVSITFTED